MAFQQVTVENRVSEFPNRRTLTKEDNTTEIVTVTRNEGKVSTEGTAWGAAYANDLESRINTETNLLETNFGHVETNTTASKSYSVGEALVLNGQMYKVTAAIAQGATLNANSALGTTNIAGHSVSEINSNLGTLTFAQNTDGKWGYKVAGADPVIPFSSIKVRHTVTNTTPGQWQNWVWSRKILPSPEVQIAGGSLRVDTYAGPANINLNIIQLVTRNGATGIVTYKNRIAYPITVTPSSGSQFTVAAGGTFTDGGVVSAEYISQDMDELRSICTNIT